MKKLLKIFAVTFAFAGICQMALALTISGTVVDNDGAPLAFATVSVPGTSRGTTTNNDGQFTLPNVAENESVVVSFLGYKAVTVTPSSMPMNIKLETNSQKIDEVVVTAKAPKDGDKCTLNSANSDHANASEARIRIINGSPRCMASKCVSGQYELKEYKCVDITGTPCTSLPSGAADGTRRYDAASKKIVCEIKSCKSGYEGPQNNTCSKIGGACRPEQLPTGATKGNREFKDGAEICIATECETAYDLDAAQGICVSVSGDCDKNDLPANATAGKRTFDAAQNKVICVATACTSEYTLKDGKCENNLTQQQSAQRLNELRDNADAMKAKEQSDANRMLGAAGIGAVGIGGMQLASGLAEQKADEEAEADMRAYLETIRCDFGQGRNHKLGEMEIILPGGNDMFDLYQQYITVADDLKDMKNQLGMAPGIESEVIIDKAETGLYDSAAMGITGGSFASFARAQMNPGGPDAIAWAEQIAKAQSKTKTGAIVAGAGVAGTAIANLAINTAGKKGNNLFGQPTATESSRAINEKYKKLATAAQTLQSDLNAATPAAESCGDGATGTHPNCDCGANKTYVTETKTCVTIDASIDCGSDERAFVTTDNTCACAFGYDYETATKTCVCKSPKREREDKKVCLIEPITLPSMAAPTLVAPSISLPTTLAPMQTTPVAAMDVIPEIPSAAFKLNESVVQNPYLTAINKFAQTASTETQFQGCYYITGHTDKTGSENLNKRLSQDRATAVQKILTSNGISANQVLAVGRGWDLCETEGKCPNGQATCKTKTFSPDDDCRKVRIQIVEKPCVDLKS